ncbi:ATP-dependent DNA ligase [Rugosimonospora acidiphila]
MLAVAAEVLPPGPGWVFEPKWDGWRAIAECGVDRAPLYSRSGRSLTGFFPDVSRMVHANVPPGVILDGELIIWDGQQTNFALLQRRVSSGSRLLRMARDHPAHYVVFDLLRDRDGQDLLHEPLSQRRRQLAALLADAPAALTLCPQTADRVTAQEWLTEWVSAGIEGVVAKRRDSRYHPGQRRDWYKIRSRLTTEAIIGGVTGTLSAPQTLLLGRLDARGRLRYTGRSHSLSAQQQQDLGWLLIPPAPYDPGRSTPHPWPQPLPPNWSGQFNRPQPLRYRQVLPVLVAEIQVDTAYEYHRWRHPVRFIRIRTDMSVYDVPPWGTELPR